MTTPRARFAILLAEENIDVPSVDIPDWKDASVVMTEIVPECYALVVATAENGEDKIVFSSIIREGMDFTGDEAAIYH
ncbi:hypothetical protein GSI_04240 [Ganoderma sinense ZZ0214-1]|uniref:Uncharacterized protein n=1 Tax=Ganoderma sinense ZZ0214-1 TaxID=1077348 RepID=A0A2G8SIS5_9APHY|nr:hypothetical protein GSI_04240 [Ganoderma sinense ZZ0214-1]